MENWRPVKDYEDLYQVSDLGRIKSLPKSLRIKSNSRRLTRERIISGSNIGIGYLGVSLGRGKMKSIHRIVAEAFLPNPEEKTEVNHINGIKADNRVVNLEWATRSENMKHAFRKGLNRTVARKRVVCINSNIRFPSISSAAKQFGMSEASLSRRLNLKIPNDTSLRFV
jgi:hypothetical protein